MPGQGIKGETQCAVCLQLWSISSKASCLAPLWSVLPGTCINWAHNWIVVFISSSSLLSSLGYGLLKKGQSSLSESILEDIFIFVCTWLCCFVIDEKQFSSFGDQWQCICSQRNLGFSNYQTDTKQPLRNALLEQKQSAKVINILVDVLDCIQNLSLQECLCRICMWH